MKAHLIILTLAALTIFAGCKKKEPTPSPNNNNNNYTTCYLRATIASGGSINVEENNTNTTVEAISQNNTFTTVGGMLAIVSGDATSGYTYDYQAGVRYGKTADYPTTNSEGYNFFATGAGSFGDEANEAQGFVVVYKDGSGTTWRSDLGTKDQTGSAINITQKSTYDANAILGYTVTGTFNCKVYDGSGNSLTLTDGTFLLRFPY